MEEGALRSKRICFVGLKSEKKIRGIIDLIFCCD